MAALSAAAKLRAAICRRGRYPVVQGWDRVELLQLCDPELVELHHRLLAALRRGEDLAAVPLPADVSTDQAALMAKVVAAAPVERRSLVRRLAMEPRPMVAEAKIEELADEALEAMGQAARWLATRVRPRS